jgi:F0F1-type ATP synthase assembly protein I
MSGKRKALFRILINSVIAILLVGLVLLVQWRAPSRSSLYSDMAIFVGYLSVNGIILYANGKRIGRERASAKR